MQAVLEIFSLHGIFTLGMLVLLQAVLGFDNLLYISIESKRVPPEQQSSVRRWGIGLAIALRILLLLAIMTAIEHLQSPFLNASWKGVFEAEVNVHSLIVLAGGVFIIYTATKEIYHMLSLHELEHSGSPSTERSITSAIVWITIMNLVFSFDSTLSALALTQNFPLMAIAIVASGLMMIWLADRVAVFLQRNRMYEVLGLFILLIVGVMLLAEGGHIARIHLFGHVVEPMAKSTFYFVIAVMVIVDVVQSRYQQKLLAQAHKPT